MKFVFVRVKLRPASITHHKVAPDTKLLKELEVRGLSRAARIEQLRHFVAQLECCALESHVASWGDLEDEAKVNVDQVAL